MNKRLKKTKKQKKQTVKNKIIKEKSVKTRKIFRIGKMTGKVLQEQLERVEDEMASLYDRIDLLGKKRSILIQMINGKGEAKFVKNEKELFELAYDIIVEDESYESIALDVCFNLCLIFLKKRKTFLIQTCDFIRTPEIRERISAFVQTFTIFSVVSRSFGDFYCLREVEQEVREFLDVSEEDKRVGILLGLPYAANLKEIHKHRERFSVNLQVCLLKDAEGTYGQEASFMSMVGTEEHSLQEIMSVARDYRLVARKIDPRLRVQFRVCLYDEDDPRMFDECVEEHHHHEEGCGHESVQHGDHIDFVVGDELHHLSDGHCHIHAHLPASPTK
eukprot:NODE_4690_length_1130_cov_36.905660_g4157_i0.p1 GENE.NODE_4690_length_1130_cov_36.905660_g4157_i0~~NODE_4690_length_1130_cov_36.905660_g4157_i0.p1  ORF type:complete len:344 (-),score=41.55 NODE_4690_length_1130_cov_36.905660_g4157_i0:99-1094(-)